MQLRVFECKCLSVCVCVYVSVSVFELRLWLGSDVGDVCDVVATLRRLMLRFYCVYCVDLIKFCYCCSGCLTIALFSFSLAASPLELRHLICCRFHSLMPHLPPTYDTPFN